MTSTDTFNPFQDQIEHGENLVNPITGQVFDNPEDVIDRASPGRMITSKDLWIGQTPRHIEELKKHPKAVQAKMLARYTGSEPELFTNHLGKEIVVIGAVLYWSGPYVGLTDGQEHEGYYTILLRTSMVKEQKIIMSDDTVRTHRKHIVLKCSGKRIAEWALLAMNANGWYDWAPENYISGVLSKGEDGAYRFSPIEMED